MLLLSVECGCDKSEAQTELSEGGSLKPYEGAELFSGSSKGYGRFQYQDMIWLVANKWLHSSLGNIMFLTI